MKFINWSEFKRFSSEIRQKSGMLRPNKKQVFQARKKNQKVGAVMQWNYKYATVIFVLVQYI